MAGEIPSRIEIGAQHREAHGRRGVPRRFGDLDAKLNAAFL
jgi:hypothetical protein